MKCPACTDVMLDIISAPLGTWERCPNCSGLFIPQEVVVSASQDRAKCVEALEETKTLLLPTERWCPKCLQKLYDGRVQSRGVILSLCSTCQSFWTSLPILRQFEELIEKTLRMQMELGGSDSASASGAAGATPSVERAEDSALGRLFRGSARLFDRVADSMRKESGDSSVKEEKPKKPAKQAKPTKPAPAKTEAPAEPVKPEEAAKPVKPTEPEPLPPAPQLDIPEFIFPEEPVLNEKVESSLPIPPAAAPIEPAKLIPQAIPVPQPKPKPSVGQKKEKASREPFDPLAFWSPWAIGALSAALSGFREFGLEGVPAMLWGLMGCSVGMMIRLMRLYPLKSFQATTLQALVEMKGPSGWRGVPVTLQGQIVPAREEAPKGVVVFRQEERIIPLNRLGRWDLIPRLFGLSNPRQLLKGDVTLKGWYRGGLTPSLEVHEVKTEKMSRKSMVRSFRWAIAVVVFVIALVIYLSLD
jgi:hypothetical protein